MNKRYISIIALLAFVTACDKKEILPGKREDFLPTKQELAQKKKSFGKIVPQPSISQEFYVDISGNKQHLSPNYKLAKDPSLIWKSSVSGFNSGSMPIAFSNMLYKIDMSGVLHCISLDDGKSIWKVPVSKQPDSAVFSGGMTANNNIIYISTNTGSVLAFDPKSQKEIWRKEMKIPLKGSPVYVDGRLIVTSIENQTIAFEAKDGGVVWSKTATKEHTVMAKAGSPAIFGSDIISGYSSGDIISSKINTGVDNWSDIILSANISESGWSISDIVASPVVFQSSVLISTSESAMTLLDAVTGSKIWERELGTINEPIIVGGFGVVLSSKNELVCFAMEDGYARWTKSINGLFEEAKLRPARCFGPLLINGEIVLFSSSGDLLYVDPSTGALKRFASIKGLSIAMTPIVVNDKIIIVSEKGEINALR